jgi:hypothetical protein
MNSLETHEVSFYLKEILAFLYQTMIGEAGNSSKKKSKDDSHNRLKAALALHKLLISVMKEQEKQTPSQPQMSFQELENLKQRIIKRALVSVIESEK